MKIMMIAGEFSGDIHGAELIKQIRKNIKVVDFFGIGGSMMKKENFRSYFLIENLQSHGLIELIQHLPRLYKILFKIRKAMEEERPDALILIDYPGFNLKLASYAKKKGIPVIFFNSPQIWAWRKHRINIIKKVVDKMIVLFPFEENIYKKAGINVSWVGHPLKDQKISKNMIDAFIKKFKLNSDHPIFVIAPGSRPIELKRHLPTILKSITNIQKVTRNVQFIFPLAQSLNFEEAKKIITSTNVPIKIIEDHFIESINSCDAAIVASGTASLQAGLALKPFIIVYKVAPLTFWIARKISSIKFIGMVNILANKEIVPELLQNDFNIKNISQKSIRILQDNNYRAKMIDDLRKIYKKLGKRGAYPRAAGCIIDFLKKRNKILN